MKEIKKIDVHAHVTLYPDLVPKRQGTNLRMPSCEELISFYDQMNIEHGVLLPIVAPEGQFFQMTTENCITAARLHPDRFSWFCNVDPKAGDNSPETDLVYILEHYKALGAKGVGELTSQRFADDPYMDNLFSACEKCDLPVIIHLAPTWEDVYGIVDELGLPRIEKILQKHPQLKLIGHSTPFWAEISSDVTEENRNAYPGGKVTEGRIWELMRKYDNLYCELSAGSGANAMMRDPENAARFLETFADRIFYGCDFITSASSYPFEFDKFLDELVYSGKVSKESYLKIVRENAINLLGIKCV